MAAFASTIFLPLTAVLVERQGWRSALVILAVLLALVTIPLHAIVLRRRPEDLGLQPDGVAVAVATPTGLAEPSVSVRDALSAGAFWWLALAFSLAILVSIARTVHLVPFLVETGYDAALGATAAGLSGAMQAPARIVLGPLMDRLPMRPVTAALFTTQALALACLVLVPGLPGVMVFAVAFGLANGAMTTARPALLAELYGRAHYGAISGSMTASGVVARAIAPIGVGAIYDLLGTYVPVWWMLALLAALGGIAVLAARPTRQASPVRAHRLGSHRSGRAPLC
jgi:cyanate permease